MAIGSSESPPAVALLFRLDFRPTRSVTVPAGDADPRPASPSASFRAFGQ